MAASDDLARLSARAKQAEDRVAAAREKAAADLERDVSAARASSQAQAEKLRDTVDAGESRLSAWWADVQRELECPHRGDPPARRTTGRPTTTWPTRS